jgi:hypothetical protein
MKYGKAAVGGLESLCADLRHVFVLHGGRACEGQRRGRSGKSEDSREMHRF